MSNFSVAFRDAGSATILAVCGELDAHTAPELESAIKKCRDEGKSNLIVSGSELDYISSAGLGVFMAFIEEIRTLGGDIKICALKPRIFDVFDLLGFPKIYHIVETEEEALSLFEQGIQPIQGD
ncbi:MAG: STAS domain-containing protein [Bacteroidota bacterium]|nr:STAS domain-containing protein [Bacteroidota bacterium]MXW15117.1 STAS domain-containing protein [Rhodothermaceae bacterium]MCY3629780.1 STAS domain-containing protein [Bacteroidota bacterium]MDE2645816.1 STAS domain-containing protein [Bacteroidota bacterium]MXW31890.1 STAS domain-containing protein [Rhodothermaceae bacterium]